MNDDLISRRKAIDALADDLSYYGSGDERAFGMSRAIGIIEKLPSAQPIQNNTSNALKSLDCIDRQAAIDCCRNEWEEEVAERIEALPSVQPQSTMGQVTDAVQSTKDCISRQAAIEALGEKPLVWDDLSDFDLGKAAQWSDDVDAIKELPSAQPQRMKGKWMRRDIKGIPYCCSVCSGRFDYEWKFCPNCGSDMRGDENETD